MTSLQFTKKIKLDSKKQMQQLIHIWYLNCFLNQKWTCFIVCESCVFLCLVLEVTQGSDETTSFYETYLQECRSCLDHFRMKYRNPLECYCTLLKPWLKWQKFRRMDCHVHSRLSGVPLDTLGREDWGNTQLGDILDSTGSALLLMSRVGALVNLAPLNYVKLFFPYLVEIFQRKRFF